MTTQASTTKKSIVRPRMRKLSEFVYLAESSSQPGTGHKVDIASGRCGCTAGSYGRRCHHLALAEQMDRAVEALRAQAEEQRATARQSRTDAVATASRLVSVASAATGTATVSAPLSDGLAVAEARLDSARRALADTGRQADEFAVYLRHVDQAERAYAALAAQAVREA